MERDITTHVEHIRDSLAGGSGASVPDDVIRAHVEQAVAYVEAGGMGWSIEARAIATIRHAYRPQLYAHPDVR